MSPGGSISNLSSAVTTFAEAARASGQAAQFNEETLTAPTRDRNPPLITSTQQLARQTARRCRALRADVGALPEETLKTLTDDWRDVLFPEIADDEFIDAYT
ncbi:MAG: hypothetical protein OXB92_03225, partial [Acidimicrobiaceae bacterium]|nr:hypothetical protein [Acidimicrobiaceae bacterium]